MNKLNEYLAWVQGYSRRHEGEVPNTYVAEYRLTDLMNKGHINRSDGVDFLQQAGLTDFFWELTWPEDFETPDEYLVDTVGNAQGFAVFIHGWTGNHRIWEELPGLVVHENRQLVAISVDHNGFGQSPFKDTTPSLDECNPPAAMQTIQRWIDLIKIRRQPGDPRHKIINFIGHSMGGAMLFYLNPIFWRFGEVTRYALAPALLLEDEIHRVFYTTLGLGIGILQKVPALEIVERFIKPGVIKTLAAGASEAVKRLHSAQYEETPRGTTGATFMAMGRLRDYEIPRNWEQVRVMLGHRDVLVGLVDMMDLLGKLEFPAGHIRVVPGTHYMFSVGNETPHNAYQHAQNRDLVVEDIIMLHNQALQLVKKGQWVG
jgi:pimeloyl-ACP methyl ester carboxylesterase